MPQIFSQLSDLFREDVHFMIWEINEPLPFFNHFPKEWEYVNYSKKVSPIKQLESNAARFCLFEICKKIQIQNLVLLQNDRRRPYFMDSDWHISITHSYPYVAAICSKNMAVGIDLERFGRKIEKISTRFLSAEEWARWQNSEISLTKAWTIKEAIYKAMNIHGLSFQKEIILPELAENPSRVFIKGMENEIYWENFDQFTLAITRIVSKI